MFARRCPMAPFPLVVSWTHSNVHAGWTFDPGGTNTAFLPCPGRSAGNGISTRGSRGGLMSMARERYLDSWQPRRMRGRGKGTVFELVASPACHESKYRSYLPRWGRATMPRVGIRDPTSPQPHPSASTNRNTVPRMRGAGAAELPRQRRSRTLRRDRSEAGRRAGRTPGLRGTSSAQSTATMCPLGSDFRKPLPR